MRKIYFGCDEMDNKKIGKQLQYYRESAKVTQQEMADECGLSKNYISALERGVNKCNVQTLIGYCRKLNVTPNELLGIETLEKEKSDVMPELLQLLATLDREQQTKIFYMLEALL